MSGDFVHPSPPQLSPERLSAALAQMMERSAQGSAAREDRPRPCEVSPRSIVEALLFVGRSDGRPFTTRELAAVMGDVGPGEVAEAIAQLNEVYHQHRAAYIVQETSTGYRLMLRDEFARMREKFLGRVRESKLSQPAIEVLAVVLYNQPVTLREVDELRGSASSLLLSALVRRQLIRLERPSGRGNEPVYSATDRCLRLLGLRSLAELPLSEELQVA
jgi:segregation and condensation protein B